ncbi:hypothetical protein SAMN05518871_107144 [Psychrobacillus sp. OK028]|nr:hypothetical protein SAMN05518871_107144 [Psychrobacillus sp. OK028]
MIVKGIATKLKVETIEIASRSLSFLVFHWAIPLTPNIVIENNRIKKIGKSKKNKRPA